MALKVFSVSGPPGCGKGTLIKGLFDEKTHIVPMSALLMEARKDPVIGEIVSETMDSGALVPSEIVIETFSNHWHNICNINENIVLDGVIRTNIQAIYIANIMSSCDEPDPSNPRKYFSININVPIGECKRRMAGRGRSDDIKDEVTARRFRYWTAFTEPAVTRLGYAGFTQIEIDGRQSAEEVLQEARQKTGL